MQLLWLPHRHITREGWIILALMGVSLLIHLFGIKRDLPWTPEIDETYFVRPVMHMIITGSWNPQWFGHPGSTVIYPLAFLGRIWNTIAHQGYLFGADPDFTVTFDAYAYEFYILGRLITISYSVLCIPLVYLIGRRVFNPTISLIGAGFMLLSALVIEHGQTVRSDTAAAFWSLLSIWLCLSWYEAPSYRRLLLTCIAMGMAIATRYFMVALIPVFLVANVLIALGRLESWSRRVTRFVITALFGGAVIVGAFVIATPFLVLDFRTALTNILGEARSSHLGADGLSPIGNFWWYVSDAIPRSTSWPHLISAMIGIAQTVRQRSVQGWLLLIFMGIFLFGISLSGLHWQRWIIQIIPIVWLFAAAGLVTVAQWLARFFKPAGSVRMARYPALLGVLIILASIWPAGQVAALTIRYTGPSTRELAREWILQHLPPGSKIAQEWYTAPLRSEDFIGYEAVGKITRSSPDGEYIVFSCFALAQNRTLDAYHHDGYDYLVVSSQMYDRFLAEPERYADETAFYQRLFRETVIVQEFLPSAYNDGPIIHIYSLRQGYQPSDS